QGRIPYPLLLGNQLTGGVSAIKQQIVSRVLRDLVAEVRHPRLPTLECGVDEPQHRHCLWIDQLALGRPFSRDGARKALGGNDDRRAARSLGRTAVEGDGKAAPWRRPETGLLVEAPGQLLSSMGLGATVAILPVLLGLFKELTHGSLQDEANGLVQLTVILD